MGHMGNWVTDLAQVTPEVSCDIHHDLVHNCQYYADDGAGGYECVRCEHGMTSRVPGSNVMENCNSEVELCASNQHLNVPLYWTKLLSCQTCIAGHIPLLVYNGEDYGRPQFDSFQSFNPQSLNWKAGAGD